MATTVTELPVDTLVWPHGWSMNCESDDLSGCEEIRAAIAGHYLYIKDVHIVSPVALAVEIGEGETAGAVTTILIGPIYTNNLADGIFDYTPPSPIRLSINTPLTVDTDIAGLITIIVNGYIKNC